MTTNEKVVTVKTLVDNDPTATDSVLAVYLQLAASKMIERLYPLNPEKDASEIPARYDMIQCELAARLFMRKGSEAESSHEENGVNRVYDSVDDEDILSRLTPFAKVV